MAGLYIRGPCTIKNTHKTAIHATMPDTRGQGSGGAGHTAPMSQSSMQTTNTIRSSMLPFAT